MVGPWKWKWITQLRDNLEVESLGRLDRNQETIYYRIFVWADYLIHLPVVGDETTETVFWSSELH